MPVFGSILGKACKAVLCSVAQMGQDVSDRQHEQQQVGSPESVSVPPKCPPLCTSSWLFLPDCQPTADLQEHKNTGGIEWRGLCVLKNGFRVTWGHI